MELSSAIAPAHFQEVFTTCPNHSRPACCHRVGLTLLLRDFAFGRHRATRSRIWRVSYSDLTLIHGKDYCLAHIDVAPAVGIRRRRIDLNVEAADLLNEVNVDFAVSNRTR